MVYSNEELTQRVKQLENIVLYLMDNAMHGGSRIPTICVNGSLHFPAYGDGPREHPPTLQVPHYMWQPQIDWGRNLINLHPENRPRA